ncbi:MAG TPA: hypothetical protein VMT50_06870, partial [Steroidobacteraceae bacterium]|nr:hypothetical protein [Steroidobacteraceae bacterium]
IDYVSFSTVMQHWEIHTMTLGVIRINVLVPGAMEFMRELAYRRNVDFDAKAQRALHSPD